MPTTCIYRRKANEAQLTTLAPVRGKIVLVRDYPGGDPYLGIQYDGSSIADDYKVYATWLSKENKKKDVSDNIMASILRYMQYTLHITFMSGSTGVSPELWANEFNK